MTFLEKIEMLMNHKGINKRQLSINSDIPYSTIDNLWKKGYDNIKLSTLKKLSDYFNVSLDFLVRDEIDDLSDSQSFLSEHEKSIIAAYRQKENMQAAVDTLLGVTKTGGDAATSSDADIVSDQVATIEKSDKAFIGIHTK